MATVAVAKPASVTFSNLNSMPGAGKTVTSRPTGTGTPSQYGGSMIALTGVTLNVKTSKLVRTKVNVNTQRFLFIALISPVISHRSSNNAYEEIFYNETSFGFMFTA
jgi:hypothetical protein